MMVVIHPRLAVVEKRWRNPLGAAVFAFSGYRDSAVAESADQALYATCLQVNGGFGPVTVRRGPATLRA
jgi:hypothetical protein